MSSNLNMRFFVVTYKKSQYLAKNSQIENEYHILRIIQKIVAKLSLWLKLIPEGMSKCHYCITNKLQLGFKLCVFFREFFLSGAVLFIMSIIRRFQGPFTSITTFEVIFPKLWNNLKDDKLWQTLFFQTINRQSISNLLHFTIYIFIGNVANIRYS